MKRRHSLFLFFLFSFSAVWGQGSYDALLKKGLDLAYNFRFEESEKAFNKAIETAPERPEAFNFIAQNHLWAFLGSNDIAEYRIFTRWSDIALGKAEAMQNSAEKYYITGNIRLLRSAALQAEGSMLSAFGECKAAFSSFEDAIDKNHSFYAPYKGLGLIYYALDFIPGVLKFAVSLTGIKADREMGFNYIRTAYKKSTVERTESAFHLAKLYTDYLAEYDSSLAVLKPLINQYPLNPLFNYQAAVDYIKKGELNEAEKFINTVLKLNYPSVKRMNLLALFLKGEIYFYRNDFDDAAKIYEEFINNAPDADYTGIANYRLAVCYTAAGNRDACIKALKEAQNGNPDIPDDDFAKSESARLNGNGITKNELIVVTGENNTAAHKFEDALKTLLPFVNGANEQRLKGRAFLSIAECYLETKRADEGLKYLYRFDSEGDYDKGWMLPYSLYLKSLAELSKGNIAKAKEYCLSGEGENDYDYKDKISSLLNNIKRRIFKK